jgi:membrane protease YdiL (CAAX protease family)
MGTPRRKLVELSRAITPDGLLFVLAPLLVLALGLITFRLMFNESVVFSNEDLSHATPPIWLSDLLRLVGTLALVGLPLVSVLRAREVGPLTDDKARKARIALSFVLISVLVAKMVAFEQYSILLYVAIGACVLFLVTVTRDQSQPGDHDATTESNSSCELTAGGQQLMMEAPLAADVSQIPTDAPQSSALFPYANWGRAAALRGILWPVLASIVVQSILLSHGYLEGVAVAAVGQATLGMGFIISSLSVARQHGAGSIREALLRLGVRRPQMEQDDDANPSDSTDGIVKLVLWGGVIFVLASSVYSAIFGEPHQARSVDPLPVLILFTVILAPISEEMVFRGMLFGSFREDYPPRRAALVSAAIFGVMHITTGVSAIPLVILMGYLLALLYERTGSIIPCILVHMALNSVTLFAT